MRLPDNKWNEINVILNLEWHQLVISCIYWLFHLIVDSWIKSDVNLFFIQANSKFNTHLELNLARIKPYAYI